MLPTDLGLFEVHQNFLITFIYILSDAGAYACNLVRALDGVLGLIRGTDECMRLIQRISQDVCYGVDAATVGTHPIGWERLHGAQTAVEAKRKIDITLYKTTDRFVFRFTLHREYRAINLNNVIYTINECPQMYKTRSNLRNINMKSQEHAMSTITTPDFISMYLYAASKLYVVPALVLVCQCE